MPRTLLVIDDNSAVRDSMRFLLLRRGYQVLTAENGPIGIALAREQSVDGVLLDYNMPEMDGIVVCRALTAYARERGRALPIWMMTGAPSDELAADAAAAGAIVLLGKPFEFAAIYALLEAAFGLDGGAVPEPIAGMDLL